MTLKKWFHLSPSSPQTPSSPGYILQKPTYQPQHTPPNRPQTTSPLPDPPNPAKTCLLGGPAMAGNRPARRAGLHLSAQGPGAFFSSLRGSIGGSMGSAARSGGEVWRGAKSTHHLRNHGGSHCFVLPEFLGCCRRNSTTFIPPKRERQSYSWVEFPQLPHLVTCRGCFSKLGALRVVSFWFPLDTIQEGDLYFEKPPQTALGTDMPGLRRPL